MGNSADKHKVNVLIPSTLRIHTEKMDVVCVDGSVVAECLEKLTSRFPGLKQTIYDEKDQLARYIHLFVNKTKVSENYPVTEGDEIMVLIGVAGG